MADTLSPVTSTRVGPRVWIGLGAYLGYAVLVLVLGRVLGLPYTELSTTGRNLFLGAGIPLVVGSVYVGVVTTRLGWWGPVLHDRQRARHRWPIVFAILMAALALVNLAFTNWAAYDVGFFLASLVLLLVGFTEETVTRGLLLVGLRSRLHEGWVWFLTSLLFGAMHLGNALLGQPIGPTLQQVGFASLLGTVLYTLRRVTGWLVPCMVLHALWDFATFATTHGAATPTPAQQIAGTLSLLIGVVAVACVPVVIRGAKESVRTARG